MQTKYKLLKDFPNAKAGSIFIKSSDGKTYNTCNEATGFSIGIYNVERCPDWFEKIKTPEDIAREFTALALQKVAQLVPDDYIIGFKEGIEKYLESLQQEI